MVKENITNTMTCKNCGSSVVVRFGTYKGTQRYWCKSCHRKFKSEGGFHNQVAAKYISHALDMYYKGMFIKSIANHLKQEYNYYPSKSTVFNWANKYTYLIKQEFKDYYPQVGDIWILDKIRLNINEKHKVWFYYIIDDKTRFLLSSRVTFKRTLQDIERLKEEAYERAKNKIPSQIIADNNYSYLEGVGLTYRNETEQTRVKALTSKHAVNIVKRFHKAFKDRNQIIRYFTYVENMIQFTDGLATYYNYFKQQESLSGKTPAEMAGINYKIKNWSDLIHIPVAKKI